MSQWNTDASNKLMLFVMIIFRQNIHFCLKWKAVSLTPSAVMKFLMSVCYQVWKLTSDYLGFKIIASLLLVERSAGGCYVCGKCEVTKHKTTPCMLQAFNFNKLLSRVLQCNRCYRENSPFSNNTSSTILFDVEFDFTIFDWRLLF